MPNALSPPNLLSCARLPALLVSTCLWAAQAIAGLQLSAPGVEAFVVEPSLREDSTAWYAAEEWLGKFPGELTWDAESGSLTYRTADGWAVLRAQEPYVLRNGLPLEGALPVRRGDRGLLVDEAFLRWTAPALLGRELRVLAAEGRDRRRVVVDAGHGGGGGSRGSAGGEATLEQDVVLELSLVTAEALRGAGFAVHLTRSGAAPISTEKRAAVANYWDAELFVSLHAAGDGRPQARGFEVFVTPAPLGGADPQRWDAGQAGRGTASRRWAAALQEALGNTLATFDRGMTQIPSPLLEAVACPAALVEVGTLAWPDDAEVLVTPAGRERLAAAVVAAAEQFFATGEGGGN